MRSFLYFDNPVFTMLCVLEERADNLHGKSNGKIEI